MVDHRGPAFRELLGQVTEGLKRVFQTQNDVLVLTCSGTGGMEAAVVNVLSPGDPVLAISIGSFGDRFAHIATTYGAEVSHLRFPAGQAADPDRVRLALEQQPAVKAVLVTHNETSTGVTNDLESLSRVVKQEFGKLLLVDGISSVSSLPCPVDHWQLDVVVSGSQKGWMAPPGLAFISMSPLAWEAFAQARMPRVYLDLERAKKSFERGQTPWTPAVSVVYGLNAGLQLLLREGLENVYQRHAALGERTRRGVQALGLELLAEERFASNTVTAIKVPPGVKEANLRQLLREEYGVVLAGGQDDLAGKIVRIGHLGFVEEKDIDSALDALGKALARVSGLA